VFSSRKPETREGDSIQLVCCYVNDMLLISTKKCERVRIASVVGDGFVDFVVER
jgi:hypothetical protein